MSAPSSKGPAQASGAASSSLRAAVPERSGAAAGCWRVAAGLVAFAGAAAFAALMLLPRGCAPVTSETGSRAGSAGLVQAGGSAGLEVAAHEQVAGEELEGAADGARRSDMSSDATTPSGASASGAGRTSVVPTGAAGADAGSGSVSGSSDVGSGGDGSASGDASGSGSTAGDDSSAGGDSPSDGSSDGGNTAPGTPWGPVT